MDFANVLAVLRCSVGSTFSCFLYLIVGYFPPTSNRKWAYAIIAVSAYAIILYKAHSQLNQVNCHTSLIFKRSGADPIRRR
jgi:hypothetical protein